MEDYLLGRKSAVTHQPFEAHVARVGRAEDAASFRADPRASSRSGVEECRGAAGGEGGTTPGLAEFLRHVLDRWRTLVTAAGAAGAVAGLYLLLATPGYTATSLLLIDTKAYAGLRSTAPVAVDANVESANVESQIEIIKSDRVVRKLVEAERLADDPALAPGALATAVDAVKAWILPGKELAAGADGRTSGAVRAMRDRLVARRVGLTYAVELSATMPDPVQAARIVNAYGAIFIADQAARREETARNLSKLLEARTVELQARTQDADRKVEDLKFSGSLAGGSSAFARVALKDLESSARSLRVLYDKFLERSAETFQQQFLSLPDAQLASPAYPPLGKSSPRSLVVLAGALLIGFALGLIRLIIQDLRLLGLQN